MADVKNLKDRGIPLKIDGATRFVKGATKYTTCADVIKMVLKKTGIDKEYRHLFALYELTQSGERALPGKTRVLKLAKEWDGERNKFALRKVNPLDKIVSESKPTVDKVALESISSSQSEKPKETKKQNAKLLSKLSSKFKAKGAQKTKAQKHAIAQKPEGGKKLNETASDSDSSLEDFFSGIDRRKMKEFIKFFNAMATNEESHAMRKKVKASTGSSDCLTEYDIRRGSQLKSCRRVSRRKSSHKRGNARRRPISDVHPSKIHSVQRLDYGFIDSMETTGRKQSITSNSISSNSLTSNSDIDECQAYTESNFQRNRFHIKRYFRQSHAKSHDIKALANEKVEKALGVMNVDTVVTKSLKVRAGETDLKSKCHEIWHEDFRRENDSAPESLSSDDSTDRDSVLAYFDRIMVDDDEMIPGENFIVNRLVDYSITDDECSGTDSDDGLFETNIMDVGYATAETSLSESVSSVQLSSMDTSYSDYGYHDNKAFCSDSVYDDAPCSKNDTCEERNFVDVVNTSDYIRSLFSNEQVQTEDEEMDSFMQSKIYDESLDEGFSWIQSDGETNVNL